MKKPIVVRIATLFGLGYFPLAPGTLGALAGLIFYIVTSLVFKAYFVLLLSLFLILIANIICDIAEKEIGEKDPSCVILDEFVAMPICFIGENFWTLSKVSVIWLLFIGFVLFRIFDITKPLGIKQSQNLSGGLGIVTDDIIAAIYTNIVLSVICLTVL